MKRYNKAFEETYFHVVNKHVDTSFQAQIVNSCKKYFPANFFQSNEVEKNFKQFILSEYSELERVCQYIRNVSKCKMMRECFERKETETKEKCFCESCERNELYEKYYATYSKIRDENKDSDLNGMKMNIKIVLESEMLVCPYCNRDYINSRGENKAGAQLDHFFNRSKFPIFSLCLYNLIPVCGICNHVKGNSEAELVSPFDEKFDFDNGMIITYDQSFSDSKVKFKIKAGSHRMEENVKALFLKEAYEIHSVDIQELIQKKITYNKSQLKELMEISGGKLIANEMKELVFGKRVDSKEFGKRPLSKLRHNILKELGVYN